MAELFFTSLSTCREFRWCSRKEERDKDERDSVVSLSAFITTALPWRLLRLAGGRPRAVRSSPFSACRFCDLDGLVLELWCTVHDATCASSSAELGLLEAACWNSWRSFGYGGAETSVASDPPTAWDASVVLPAAGRGYPTAALFARLLESGLPFWARCLTAWASGPTNVLSWTQIGGGHINHSIFRKNFSLDRSDPLAELKKAFERDLYELKK
ncbi:cytoplasmic superoxide dismutase [Culex quinquefasciatus]|uniref:Cytoplasmic superoxide dismutase n=1 Tax=Culex quinquefasciatus TaxID=7176 RepID=B0X0L3_CULQU|nr:cytoplasmic superoxide dismutase [Culex quinquefasciatus]|eukprot:XP_001863185.1 cytoplasmic superoxide dismutase [Culex quinquefasciatus]